MEKKAVPTVECPIDACDEVLWTREGLADHCKEAHKTDTIDFEVEEEKFKNTKDFEVYHTPTLPPTVALPYPRPWDTVPLQYPTVSLQYPTVPPPYHTVPLPY